MTTPPPGAPPLDVWAALLEQTELPPAAQRLAQARVATLAAALRRRVARLLWLYRGGKITVTVGALLVPALTGLDSTRALPQVVFWLIWCLSLATGASNACLALFGVDRKYFLLKEQLTRLEAEAWLYLALAGKYKAAGGHADHFTGFVEKCEAILDRAARLQDRHPQRARDPDAARAARRPPPDEAPAEAAGA